MGIKKKLLIFSQCNLYGGSERLMLSIYNNKAISNQYNVIFSYSYFKDYDIGLKRDNVDSNKIVQFLPLYLLTNGNLFHKINLKFSSKLVRRGLKIPLFLLELTGVYSLWNSLYFLFGLICQRPELVHINNGGYPAAKACNQLARVLVFFPKVRVIYQVNNKAEEKKGFGALIKDMLVNSSVDLFLTHSAQNRIALINRGFDPNKIVTFPSYFKEPIDNGDFKNIGNSKKFELCMVGFLSHRKGQYYLLQALNVILKMNHPIKDTIILNLVGDGEERYKLKNYIDENNLGDNVKLLGNRSDYLRYIKSCDVYMMTSVEGEDLPLVLLSSMQFGKCIIASDFAGISDLLTDKYDSLLISPNLDTIVNDIVLSLIYLFDNPEIRDKLSFNVLKTFEEKLGEEKYSNNLLKIYNN